MSRFKPHGSQNNKTLCECIFGRGCNKRTCMRDMWVVQCYCIFEGLVETCEAVGVELYWKLIAKLMGVVCRVVARFLYEVIFIRCW